MRACACVVKGESSVGIMLVFLYKLLQLKGKGKMQWVQIPVMIKMPFVITLVSAAVMIINFN